MEVYLPYETPTGPQLEVLGEVETKLPQPVQRRATAWVLTAAVALAAVFGLGGMKLQSAHRAAVTEFTTGAHEEYEGFSLSGDLNERLEAGATLAKIGKQQLGETNAFVSEAFAQVDALKEALASGSPAACYRANTALGKAVEALYPNLQENDTAKAQWEEFKSRQYTIDHSAYNTVAEQYNDRAAAFPANLIGAVWGATEVERFA